MSAATPTVDRLVAAVLSGTPVAEDLVWALEWLDTLTDCLGEHHMVDEFVADLKLRRKESAALDAAARRAHL